MRVWGVAGQLSAGAQEQLEAESGVEAMEDMENLLESYFILIDSTFDRLMSLGAARAPNIVPGCYLPIPNKISSLFVS